MSTGAGRQQTFGGPSGDSVDEGDVPDDGATGSDVAHAKMLPEESRPVVEDVGFEDWELPCVSCAWAAGESIGIRS